MGRSAQWSTKRTSALLSRGKTIAIPLKVLHNKWHYKSNITAFHLWCNWYVRTIDHHENFNKVTDKLLCQNICLYHPRVASLCSCTEMWMLIITPLVLIRPVSGCLQCCSAACVTTMTGECWHLHARDKNQESWIDEDRGWRFPVLNHRCDPELWTAGSLPVYFLVPTSKLAQMYKYASAMHTTHLANGKCI